MLSNESMGDTLELLSKMSMRPCPRRSHEIPRPADPRLVPRLHPDLRRTRPYREVSAPVRFFSAAPAIVPLARLIVRATEQLSTCTGDALGGLLNATFGNSPELIIALVALKSGYLDMVRASLIRSILANLLLALGLAFLLGGIRHHVQVFNPTAARSCSSMMMIAVVSLVAPSTFSRFFAPESTSRQEQLLNLCIAGVLLVAYVLYLVFSLKTHPGAFPAQRPKARPCTRANDRAWHGVPAFCSVHRRCLVRLPALPIKSSAMKTRRQSPSAPFGDVTVQSRDSAAGTPRLCVAAILLLSRLAGGAELARSPGGRAHAESMPSLSDLTIEQEYQHTSASPWIGDFRTRSQLTGSWFGTRARRSWFHLPR